jgi:hypothetical protein
MGGKNNTTTTTQNQTYAPTGAGYITNALNQAQNAAQLPFSIPQAPVAGFNQTQQNAFNTVNNAQGMAQPYINQAQNYFQQGTQPNISQFFNPMASAVTSQLNNIFGQQQSQNNASLTQAAGGVGADRIAVGQGNLANQQGLAAGQTLANLYQPAVGAALQQESALQGAGYGEAALGSQAQNAALQGAQAQLGTGGLQQQLAQAQLNSPYQQQLAQAAFPYQQAQFLAGITGSLAPGLGGTTYGTGTTTGPTPSIWSQLLGAGTAAAGIYGGFGGFGGGGQSLATGSAIPGAVGPTSVNGAPLNTTTYAQGGATFAHRFPQGYDNGGGVSDEPINVDTQSIIPQVKTPSIQPHIPQLNLNPPQQSGGGGGGGGAGEAVGDIMKIAGMFMQRGGAANPYARGGYADGGSDFGAGLASDADRATGTDLLREAMTNKYGVNPNDPFRMPDAESVNAWRQGVDADHGGAPAPPGEPSPLDDAQWPFGPNGKPDATRSMPVAQNASAPAGEAATPAEAAPTSGSNPFVQQPMARDRKDAGFAASPWAALTAAGLGIMGGTSPFAGVNIGQGGLKGLQMLEQQRAASQKDETIQQAADRLAQEAKFHEDEYTRVKPYEQFMMHRPVPMGQHIDPTTYLPMTTYGIMQPDNSIKPVDTSNKTGPDAALPPNASPTEGWIPGQNVPEGVRPEVLQNEPDGIANMVKSIDEGRSRLADVPARQRFMVEQKLHAYDKNWDETVWGLRNKQQSDLSTNGTAGKMLTAVNQLLPHLSTAFDRADALANTNYPEANTIKNWWLTATGDPRVKEFATVREVASMDAARLLRGSGQMAEKDIEAWRENIASQGSPQQLKKVISLLADDLIGARISSLQHEYRQNMRQEPPEFLSPEAKSALAKIKAGKAPQAGAQPQAGAGGAKPDPATRFGQLTAGGMSKEQAYAKMHQEGY